MYENEIGTVIVDSAIGLYQELRLCGSKLADGFSARPEHGC